MTAETLPDWPPPDGEPIGMDRDRAYNVWIRDHAGPLVVYGRQRILERYPGKATHTYSTPTAQLATWALDPRMSALNIGGVWAEETPGAFVFMNINIRRDGLMECVPSLRMRN